MKYIINNKSKKLVVVTFSLQKQKEKNKMVYLRVSKKRKKMVYFHLNSN